MSDPTTTLVTFMLSTSPSVHAVRLVGSWDNFGKTYNMERDSRRDRGQWRGCHSFKDITVDGEARARLPRNGGLKMGHTYYYYYEVDGTTETHDPSAPSTNTCPFLPGQTVNTLFVPVEKTSRTRTASANSARREDFRTMDPDSKFVSPRPAPAPPVAASRNVGTASGPTLPPAGLAPARDLRRSARSLSPASSRWAFASRKLFSRQRSSSSLRETLRLTRSPRLADDDWEGSQPEIPSRDISPEPPRLAMVNDEKPAVVEYRPETKESLSLIIPDDISEELDDDDGNFAESAASESAPYTVLSPPPPITRTPSPWLSGSLENNDSQVSVATAKAPRYRALSKVDVLNTPRSHFSYSDTSAAASPTSPQSTPDLNWGDDTDSASVQEEDTLPFTAGSNAGQAMAASLSTYTLPQTGAHEGKLESTTENALGVNVAPSSERNPGLEAFIAELGWMAEVIQPRGLSRV